MQILHINHSCACALTGRVAILAAREGGEAIKANKIATSVGSVPAWFLTQRRRDAEFFRAAFGRFCTSVGSVPAKFSKKETRKAASHEAAC